MQSSSLQYKKLPSDIEQIRFNIHPYDPYVAKRMMQGNWHTVIWHVDDLKSSHVKPKVNNKFLLQLHNKYANDKIGNIGKC